MLRPSSLSRALVAVAAVLGVAAGPLSALAAPADAVTGHTTEAGEPLVVRIHAITPDYVPAHGPIEVRGTVADVSDRTWSLVNVYAFLGATPMTTPAALAAATRTPVTADVGPRITDPGTFAHYRTLRPGQRRSFRLTLPRHTLHVSAAGVYWFGVHVLATDASGQRSTVARDRTFLPLVPASTLHHTPPEDTALVVPVRSGVTRAPDGAIEDPAAWTRNLRRGDLHGAVALGRAAAGRPLTWLVDPAVPGVVRRLATGNPPRSVVAPGGGGPGSGTPSSGASPSASSSAAGAADTGSTDRLSQETPTSAQARVARRWLHHLHALLAGASDQILGVPYGDVELDSAAQYDVPLLHQAFRRTGSTLQPWGLPLQPVAAPATGRIVSGTVDALPRSTEVLLPDTGISTSSTSSSASPSTPLAVARVDGHPVVVSSSEAAQGGPGPVPPQSAIALRQRILSEAALRVLDGGTQPLVVELPTHWGRRVPGSFFSGLDVPWTRLTTLTGATASVAPRPVSASSLTDAPHPGFGPRIYHAANRVLYHAHLLQTVLPGNHVLQRRTFEEVTGNTSYEAAEDPFGAGVRMTSTGVWVSSKLDAVHLAAPGSVTLASASGHFSALVSNGLNVPITVRVRALSDPSLRITGGETVQLPAHGQTTVLLSASTHVRGVHTVTLELTNRAGLPLGSRDSFPLRAEQVSRLIWVIIGAGLALLFTAIVVRLVRRIMRSRATTPEPAGDATEPQDGEEPAAPATEPTSGTRG